MPSTLALGFATKCPPWHLVSPLFPDKIGGRPAWLALKQLPQPCDLACPTCSNPMAFVLQLYSPVDGREDCFHRVLFLFMCLNGGCHCKDKKPPFAVFRSQLPRCNAYYSFEPPENEEPSLDEVMSLITERKLPCAELFTSVCPVCGCKADKLCSKCRVVHYCSKSHQVLHWKEHKKTCAPGLNELSGPSFTENKYLLPEYRLISRTVDDSHDESGSSDSEEEPIPCEGVEEGDGEDAVLESLAKHESKEEARFRKFKELMNPDPDQVVRFGGEPFWLSEHQPPIEACEVCGAERKFEFQVTPQLLSYFALDRVGHASPDFGSLYIFTCSKSCALPRTEFRDGGGSEPCVVEYQRELVIRQMVP
ncbi:unnamed protein product [Calicophoron daubneyi]|uniref:MYND-type domain-containing protein n=1 Tax=Calicophoron daubneyi TaxID=300641 RepID=A0AAV2TN41_CALDB